MPSESLHVEKELAEPDAAAEKGVDMPLDQTNGTVPVDASAELDPALSTTVAPATDTAVDASAATEASASAADPTLGDETAPTTEPVPANGMTRGNEPVPVDAAVPAPDLAVKTDEETLAPTSPDGAVSASDPAALAEEDAVQPTIDANVTPLPVSEVAAVGPASVMVDAPILAGPGPEYGFIATAPVGSTVEQTGHMINGYVTVQYAEVTGWLALEHLGAPGMLVDQSPPTETAPVEAPLGDAPPAETSLTKTTSSDTSLAESEPPETLPGRPRRKRQHRLRRPQSMRRQLR
jgi:hypothetical protein